MTVRRMSSRRIGLTATFLALAAGGLAACDSPEPEYSEYSVYSDFSDSSDFSGYSGSQVPFSQGIQEIEDDSEEVFYCADDDGMVVEAEFCADPAGPYLLWHSPAYATDLMPGDQLDDGNHFAASDKAGRKAFQLPGTGLVANGTIKTGIVGTTAGRGSSGG